MSYDIRQIARIMGGDVVGHGQCNVPGPNHSRKDRSLSIRLTPDGRLKVHSWTNDGWQECRDYVASKLGWAGDWKPDPNRAVPDMNGDEQGRRQFALKIWADSIDPRGTLAERYLCEHRGLSLPDGVANSVIRFHHGLSYRTDDDQIGKYLPCMVCLLRDIKSNEPTGIHRTFLDRYSGEKIDRRMLGIAKGAAIKLDGVSTTSLTIGEGVETVLAAREAGFVPAWALGSSKAVKFFPVLSNVGELTLLLENDPTSRSDVKACAQRYLKAERRVTVIEPNIGSDFNDCWRARHG